jgi:uncharacterized protein
MIEKIKARARKGLAKNDDAHGYPHAQDVANLVNTIHRHEGGDILVLGASSYLHDWCIHGGREYHVSIPALYIIREELRWVEFPVNKIEAVIDVIRHHEDYDFHSKNLSLSKECLILQDADRLDALGAKGIGRNFYTACSLGAPFGTPDDMHALAEPYHLGQVTSAIQHFYTKLLHLKDAMNTEFARGFAQERHDYMLEFLQRYKLECSGEI